eukprot:scaffold24790_cov53-Phaeocystis_antarctica.AAC.7
MGGSCGSSLSSCGCSGLSFAHRPARGRRTWCEARDTCTSSREPVERSWRSSTRESRLPGCWTALACRHCTKRTEAVASCSVSAASCSQYCCAT